MRNVRTGRVALRVFLILLLCAGSSRAATGSISVVARATGGGAEDMELCRRNYAQLEVATRPAASPSSIGTADGTYTDPRTGMEFVYVKGGCFQMGCGSWTSDCVDHEKPAHEVCVDGFWMGKYEVTLGEWQKFVDATKYRGDGLGEGCEGMGKPEKFSQNARDPVACVSWNEATAFGEWLGLTAGKGYRLPTEAEWEFAARSGGKAEKYAGTGNDGSLGDYAWYSANSGYTYSGCVQRKGVCRGTNPVGQKRPNGLGLYDMSGNVWEWVNDWYDGMYTGYYDKSPRDKPQGPSSGRRRVLRGGSWYNLRGYMRTAYRNAYTPISRDPGAGFRLVLPEVK